MDITSVKILTSNGIPISDCLFVVKNGVECWVPKDNGNSDYQEILRLVEEGTLTIETVEQT